MAGPEPNTFGTIDIGSNGVRFFIGRLQRGRTQVLVDHREPIRLGQDSFRDGRISPRMVHRLVQSFLEFRRHAEAHGVLHWQAVATSALRDSRNRTEVVQEIWRRTGVHIEVIDGLTEARLLHLAVQRSMPLGTRHALLFDLGGGSLEIISARGARIQHATSLKLGTVRLLKRGGVDSPYSTYQALIHRELEDLVQTCADPFQQLIKPQLLIGTGGNLRALTRLSARLHHHPIRPQLSIDELEHMTELLFRLSLVKRRKQLRLKPNRADVIRPAAAIALEIMRNFNFTRLTIPNVGIKNGVFWKLAEAVTAGRTNRALHL
ncbi:MAG: hypothetical protein AB7K41_14165 [Bdellovibrionales bacterium]